MFVVVVGAVAGRAGRRSASARCRGRRWCRRHRCDARRDLRGRTAAAPPGSTNLAAAFEVLDSIVVLAMLAGAGSAPIAIATIGARPTLVLCGALVASLPLLTDRPRHQRTSTPSTSQQRATTLNHQRRTRPRTKPAVAAAALVVVAAGIAGSPAPAAESQPSTPIDVGHSDGLHCLLGTGTTTCTDLSI